MSADLTETQPWAYGWYDQGGKKHAYGYLPTIYYPLEDNVSEGPFPLYRANQLRPVPSVEALPKYDAGLLNDWGGGNVGWWQDYIRAELAHAHEFYATAIHNLLTEAHDADPA